MKLNKLFVFVLVLFSSLSFISAVGVVPIAGNTELYYEMENSSIIDNTPNNNDGTDSGTGLGSGIINNARTFDGSTSYIDSTYSVDIGINDEITLCSWGNTDDVSAGQRNMIGTLKEAGANDPLITLGIGGLADGEPFAQFRSDGGSSYSVDYNVVLTTGTWYYFCAVLDRNTDFLYYYVDGVLRDSIAVTGTDTFSLAGNSFFIGSANIRGSPSTFWSGSIDEVSIYNYSLNQSHIDFLYQAGAPTQEQQYPFSSVVSVNDSTESTAVVKQVGSVSFVNPTIIISSDFNISVNNTPMYGGYSFEVDSNNNNVMYCELLIDDISFANITRTNEAGVLGSVFIQTPIFMLDNSINYTQSLVCERFSGVGLITISEAVGVGHFLVDQGLNFLSYNETSFDESVVSGSSYSLIDSFNISSSNQSGIDQQHNLVIEGMIQYTNNAGVDEILSVYTSIGDTNCSFNPRFVTTGSYGSVSYDCILENVTSSTQYLINIYGNGTNSNYQGNFIVKDLYLSDEEIAGGTGVLKGTNFSGDSDVKLFNLTGGNLNHALTNVFQKVGYSVLTDVDTIVDFYVKIINGSTFTTKTFSRGFTAGELGFLIGHDVLEDVPIDDNYQLELWANCGTVGALCQIQGGASLGYITDVRTTTYNSFDIRAYNEWNGTQIMEFNATDGVVYSTTTGNITFFSEYILDNITISSSGYLDRLYVDHNTTNFLNSSIYQSIVDISSKDIYIGTNPVSWTLETNVGNFSTINDTVRIYPNLGSYDWNFIKSTYFGKQQSFIVDNVYEMFYFNDVYDTNLTFYRFGSYEVNPACVYLAITLNESYNFALQSTSSIVLSCTLDGYEPLDLSLESVDYSYPNQLSLNMTPVSLYIDVYDYLNLSQLNDFDVYIKNVSTQQVVYNATGLSVLNLTYNDTINGLMDIFVSKDGYQTSLYRVDLTAQSSVLNSMYLLINSSSVLLPVTVTNNIGTKFLSDVSVAVYGYDQYNNKLFISQMTTDSSGKVYLSLYPGKLYSLTLSKDGYVKAEKEISADEFSYVFRLTEDSTGLFDYNGFSYDFSESFSNLTALTFSCYYFDEFSQINLVECYVTKVHDPSSEVSQVSVNSQTATLDFNINRPDVDTYYALRIKAYRNNELLDKTYTLLVIGVNTTATLPEVVVPQYTVDDDYSEFLIVFIVPLICYVLGFLAFGLSGAYVGGLFAWYIIVELSYINEYMFSVLAILHIGLLFLNRGGGY